MEDDPITNCVIGITALLYVYASTSIRTGCHLSGCTVYATCNWLSICSSLSYSTYPDTCWKNLPSS